jgi:hydrophobe/amphiphile efflux-3 (HAE3) family protein
MGIAARYPRWIIGISALLTLLALPQLKELEIKVAADGMMLEDDPAKRFLDQTRAIFGGEEGMLLIVKDSQLISAATLEKVDAARLAVQGLPYVDRTVSLFDVNRIQNLDDNIVTRPFFDPLPQNPEQAQEILEAARHHPLVRDTLISNDGESLAIAIYFSDDRPETGFDEQVVADLAGIVSQLKQGVDEAYTFGTPTIRATITERIIADQQQILPAALALLLLLLALAMGRPSAAILPMLTAGLSVIWTLALMALTDSPLGVMTSIVPALLVIIGSTEDIHMLADFREGRRKGLNHQQALTRMIGNMRIPLMLTFLTTYLGFLSIASNPIALLREFGLIASSGLLINFLITILLVPAWLQLFPDADPQPQRNRARLASRIAISLYLALAPHRRLLLALVALLTLLGLYQATRIQVDNDPMSYFDEQQEIARNAERLNRDFSGSQSFSIVIDSNIEGTFLKVRYLEELEALQHFLDKSELFHTSHSFADIIKLTHSIMMGEDTPLELPPEDYFLDDYIFLLQQRDISPYISGDYSMARIEIRHQITSSAQLRHAITQVDDYMQAHLDPGLRPGITGEAVLNMHAADYMAAGQAISLSIMAGVILIVITLLFLSLKAGLVALVPNLLPIAMLFGVMGYFNIPLDTSTAMVAAIALGICVDDTMHFMVRYHQHNSIGDRQALIAAIDEEAPPIFSTSLALAAGFSLLAFSDFPPVVHFGLLSALVVLAALLSTFVVTPLLLERIHLVSIWNILGLHLQERITRQCPLFANMPVWQIKQFILAGRIIELRMGESAFLEGEDGEEMYVVLEGEMRIWRRDPESGTQQIALLGPGETFGEMALVSRRPRNASATADIQSRLLQLHWSQLRRIGRILPHASAKLNLNLASILGQRLNTTANSLSDPQSGAPGKAIYDWYLNHALQLAQCYNQPLSRITLTITPRDGSEIREEPPFPRVIEGLRERVRSVDVIARPSPSEIVVILNDMAKPQARQLSESIAALFAGDQDFAGWDIQCRSETLEFD